MKKIVLKAKFLGLAVVAIAATTGVLTACSTHARNQAQAQNSGATNVGDHYIRLPLGAEPVLAKAVLFAV